VVDISAQEIGTRMIQHCVVDQADFHTFNRVVLRSFQFSAVFFDGLAWSV